MSDEGLRAALEAKLATLPVMAYENGYPVQALPKAELLGLLAMHPPTRICGDVCRSFGVDLLCRKPTGHDGEHQDVHGATWTPLPHLTDDGAAAPPADPNGTPAPTGADQAAESATTTAAPSSPHRERVLDLLHTTVFHCFDNEEFGLSAKHATAITDALFDAALFGEGATPAIDRDALIVTLHNAGAYCGDCNYEDWDLCEDCQKVLGYYADAVLKLIGQAR